MRRRLKLDNGLLNQFDWSVSDSLVIPHLEFVRFKNVFLCFREAAKGLSVSVFLIDGKRLGLFSSLLFTI